MVTSNLQAGDFWFAHHEWNPRTGFHSNASSVFGAGQTTNTDGAFVKMVANIFAKTGQGASAPCQVQGETLAQGGVLDFDMP